MSEPLATLFEQFLKERMYLKALIPKTKLWYRTAWKAFEAYQAVAGKSVISPDDQVASLTKARLQAFVVHVRDRGLKPRSVGDQVGSRVEVWKRDRSGRRFACPHNWYPPLAVST